MITEKYYVEQGRYYRNMICGIQLSYDGLDTQATGDSCRHPIAILNSWPVKGMGLSTRDIADLSLELVGWDELPKDSGIHVSGENVETALVGIDAESPEIQLAQREGYDLVLAHHPVGVAGVTFPSVLDQQVTLMTNHGVPKKRAEEAIKDLRRNWKAQAHMANYRHDASIAELLDQPYMNLHLPPDELGRQAFKEAVEESNPETIDDLRQTFEAFPEMQAAETDVEVRVGNLNNSAGEVAIHHAAGANGGASVAKAYFENGIDTVVYIHADGEAERRLREEFVDDDSQNDSSINQRSSISNSDKKNLIVTGHIASDAVGMNILIDELTARGVDCTTISGCGLGRT